MKKHSIKIQSDSFLTPINFSQLAIFLYIFFAVFFSFVIATDAQAQNTPSATQLELGRRIYEEGILASGAPLTGTRFGKDVASGTAAACVVCHRRSGLGSVEGDIQVPPISGRFLFPIKGDKPLVTMDPRVSKRFNQTHDPYTEATLAEAIVRGTNNRGREMDVLMPRYNLNDSELKALTAYLNLLSVAWSPGITNDNVRLATVITPNIDPARRNLFINMMNTIVHQKNGSTSTVTRRGGARRHMVSAAEMVLGTERNWTLDVWELQGAPETWNRQLEDFYRKQPVFALVSGLSDSTWQPVHNFCEQERVPCWFPSVNLPVISKSFYSIYFTRGVSLEADVLAHHLLAQKIAPRRVIQIYHDDEAGLTASKELTKALSVSPIKIEDRVLNSNHDAGNSLRHALDKINKNDVVMLWLRPKDMLQLEKFKPIADLNYFSTELSKADQGKFPRDWKSNAHLVYPYELPADREVNLTYFHAWLNLSKQPLIDETMQSEVFFALNFLTDTISEMLHNMYRDYLLERAETMLNKREGVKSEQENRDRLILGRAGDMEKKHGAPSIMEGERVPLMDQTDQSGTSSGTSIYPHLSLGPDQRFASKGAYIVRFADSSSDKLVAESEWIVP